MLQRTPDIFHVGNHIAIRDKTCLEDSMQIRVIFVIFKKCKWNKISSRFVKFVLTKLYSNSIFIFIRYSILVVYLFSIFNMKYLSDTDKYWATLFSRVLNRDFKHLVKETIVFKSNGVQWCPDFGNLRISSKLRYGK